MEERASSLSTDAKRGNTEGEEEEERQDLNLIFGRVSEEGEKVTFLPLCMKRRGSAERERGVKSPPPPLLLPPHLFPAVGRRRKNLLSC